MKFKIIFLLFMLFSRTAWTDCGYIAGETDVNVEKCLSLQCPEGTIPGLKHVHSIWEEDETKPFCFPCDSEESFAFDCISAEEVRRICPNRYVYIGCGIYSVLKCSDYEIKNEKERTCQDPPTVY